MSGVVVLTEGLTRHLDADAVAAVLAHERAHLAGRHHLVLASAEALRATLSLVPLFRQAPRAIGELLELVRLDRLRHGHRPPGRVRRIVSCGLAGVTAATLPFVAGTGVLLAVALVDCPLI
jgi:hypothetical protein